MLFQDTQHAWYSKVRHTVHHRLRDARRAGPGGFAIPLLSVLVTLALIALNALLPGLLG